MTQPMDDLMQTARDAGFWKDLFAYPEFKDSLTTFAQVVAKQAVEAERERLQPFKPAVDNDPCPGCRKGGVCRTQKCGRLALPVDHPYRR